jgi:hypothetical protein
MLFQCGSYSKRAVMALEIVNWLIVTGLVEISWVRGNAPDAQVVPEHGALEAGSHRVGATSPPREARNG